jgi:hypothetical protein
MRSDFDYIQSRCTRGSFIFCHKHGSLATMLAFIPNKIRSIRLVHTLLFGRAHESEFDYAQSRCTRGSFIFLAIKTANSRRCSRSFLTG